MYCSECGTKLAEDARFCNKCGTKVEEIIIENGTVVSRPIASGTIAGGTTTSGSYISPKKKRKGVIIAVCAAVVLLMLGFLLVFLTVFGGADKIRVARLCSLGDRYLSELDYEQAIAAYEAAIEIDPKAEDAYFGLAEAYIGIEDYESAAKALERGIEETDSRKLKDYREDIQEELDDKDDSVAQNTGIYHNMGNDLPIGMDANILRMSAGEFITYTGIKMELQVSDSPEFHGYTFNWDSGRDYMAEDGIVFFSNDELVAIAAEYWNNGDKDEPGYQQWEWLSDNCEYIGYSDNEDYLIWSSDTYYVFFEGLLDGFNTLYIDKKWFDQAENSVIGNMGFSEFKDILVNKDYLSADELSEEEVLKMMSDNS